MYFCLRFVRWRCSTPFGITEVGMLSSWCRRTARHGAQRLSASQRWASEESPRSKTVRMVLNAFRHHRGGHPPPAAIHARHRLCSTPFGITEVGIRGTRSPRGRRSAVLNAFRHHRGGHVTVGAHESPSPRAQRLSASQRWAYLRVAWPLERWCVPNAFRHHRGGHSRDRVRLCRSSCAQRLSASQRWALPLVAVLFRNVPRAQRLSASQRWA